MKKLLNILIKILILENPIVNFVKITEFPLISDRAYAIADKIGWDKLYEKSKEAQKNGTCIIKLAEDE
jgi:hypothetical protein